MGRRARFFLTLACAVSCAAPCAIQCRAQPEPRPAVPPKVFMLVRQQFKPGKTHARERLERAAAAAYNRLDVPVYWLDLQAFSGSSEALLLHPFDSFEDVEKAAAVLAQLHKDHPELAQLQAGIDDTLSSQTTILAVRRDSPSVSEINFAAARFLRMLLVRTRPGEELPSAIDLASSVVYQVTSGMPGPAFLILQPMTEFTDLPPIRLTSGRIVEDSLYVIDPRMSHVSKGFAGQDRTFWTNP